MQWDLTCIGIIIVVCGYSIWWINYRYNDELAKIFMTCNLVTGLFARMDHMRKYIFGSFLIFGEDDKNEISGEISTVKLSTKEKPSNNLINNFTIDLI
jgi:hypothetical protein